MMVFNPDNVADIEDNFDIVNVNMDDYTIFEEPKESYFEEDPIPSDDDIEDYETVEDDGHGLDPTEVIEPSRKKRRIRKK